MSAHGGWREQKEDNISYRGLVKLSGVVVGEVCCNRQVSVTCSLTVSGASLAGRSWEFMAHCTTTVTVFQAFWVNKHWFNKNSKRFVSLVKSLHNSFICFAEISGIKLYIRLSFMIKSPIVATVVGWNAGLNSPTCTGLFSYSLLFLSLQDQTIWRGLKTGHIVLHFSCRKRKEKTLMVYMKWFQIHHRLEKRFKMVQFPPQCPAGNEDLSKLQRVLMGSPPPSCPIKVSPRRPLLKTSTHHRAPATEIISTRAWRPNIIYFPLFIINI